MTREFKKKESKRCFACLQWDGTRSYDREKDIIKVDDMKEDNCRILHKKVRGSAVCDRFSTF
jgi:hypothetical protein